MKDIIAKFKDKPPKYGAYSFSRMQLCPAQFRMKYIDNEEESFGDTSRRDLGTMTHELFDSYVSSVRSGDSVNIEELLMNTVSPESEWFEVLRMNMLNFIGSFTEYRIKSQALASEAKLGVDLEMNAVAFDSKQAWMRGVIDYHEIDEFGRVNIIDYKNYPIILDVVPGGSLHEQLMSYACLLFANYPALEEATIGIYFSEFGVTRMLSDKSGSTVILNRKAIELYWKSLQIKMLAWEQRKDYPERPSEKGCGYCGYHRLCSYMNSRDLDKDDLIITREAAMNALNSLVAIDAKRKKLKNTIDSWVKIHGSIETDAVSLSPVLTEVVEYDIDEVLKAVNPKDISDILSINKTKLKKHKFREEIEKCKTIKSSTKLQITEKS